MDYLEDNSSKMLKELRILVGAIRGPAAQQVFPQCFNVSNLAAVTLQRLEFFIPLSCNIQTDIGGDRQRQPQLFHIMRFKSLSEHPRETHRVARRGKACVQHYLARCT